MTPVLPDPARPQAAGRLATGRQAAGRQAAGRSAAGRQAADRSATVCSCGRKEPPQLHTAARGNWGLALTGASVALTVVVAALGPSLMEPALPGAPGQPPWAFAAGPSPYLVAALAGVAILAGAAGLGLCLSAVRGGWRFSPGLLLAAGIGAAIVLAFLPPFGSSDHLSYAAYGRMVITGHNPYTTTPAQLARLGDPVARAVQDWKHSPSVYGPVGVGLQAFASWIGGTSVRLTVFVLSLLNVLAFALTGLALHWLNRKDKSRQLRAALLWTANPLMLTVLVAGAHVDSQAIVFGAGAVVLLAASRRQSALLAACAGALAGLGFAIKVTTALVGAGIAIGLLLGWRRDTAAWRERVLVLGGLAAGFAAVAGAALIPWGTAMFGPALRAGSYTSIGSPWRPVRSLLELGLGDGSAEDIVKAGALLLAGVLLALLLRAVARGQLAGPGDVLAACAFAMVFAWLLAWPYVLPWYDGLGWALLAMLPATKLDWLLLARTGALAIGYLPARGITLPQGLAWLETVVRTAVTPLILFAVVVAAIVTLWGTRSVKL